MAISQFGKNFRLASLQRIKDRLNQSKIDLEELGCNYFFLQPDGCDCIGSPKEKEEWHINHVGACLKNYGEINNK
ncbi:2201_t:CDS:1, partial [Ambispora gerdemannii]